MYQIVGTQHNKKERLIATPNTAREARTHYLASLKDFHSVRIAVFPSGEVIDMAELNRRVGEEDNAQGS